MASYTRIGSYLTVSELTVDPFGKIYRGLTLAGSSFERHCLMRVFSEELMNAGLGQKLEEANRNASFLSGSRGFGIGYHIEGGKHPLVTCDYIPGRSLSQMIEKAKHEQIPLGVDHALSVLQGLAQSLIALHSKGIHHGTLSPNSIWVSFEGATHILDAPYASIVGSLLPKCPVAAASLARYRPTASSALHLDLFSLGAILYELLTFEKLPSQDQIPTALTRATLKAAQEDGPIPAEIVSLLNRLLLIGKPFESPGAFNAELESVLYDGDYSPTTFNMAFFMHTLFREENEHDNQSMKNDQAADFSPFVVTETGQRGALESSGFDLRTWIKWGVMAAAVILISVAALVFASYQKGKQIEKLQAELADVQRKFAENQMALADIQRQETSITQKTQDLEKLKAKATTTEEKAKLDKQLEEAKKEQERIKKDKEDKLRTQQELQTRTSAIAQLAQPQPAQPKPEPVPQPVPQPVAPPPPPVQPTPTPALTNPAPTVSVQPSNAQNQPAPTFSEEAPPTIANKVQPTPPRLAFLPPPLRNSRQEVVVKVQVDAQGRPTRAIVSKGVNLAPAFDESARQAALASTYNAGNKDGKPVAGWCSVNYSFQLGSR